MHDVVMKEVDLYAHGVFGVSRNVQFYVTNSWINVHRRGQAAGQHIHGNSLISGVLYLNVNETSGDLVFHRDIYSLIPFPPALDFDVDPFNIYNCKSWSYKPKKRTTSACSPRTVMHSGRRQRIRRRALVLGVQRLRPRHVRRLAPAQHQIAPR